QTKPGLKIFCDGKEVNRAELGIVAVEQKSEQKYKANIAAPTNTTAKATVVTEYKAENYSEIKEVKMAATLNKAYEDGSKAEGLTYLLKRLLDMIEMGQEF